MCFKGRNIGLLKKEGAFPKRAPTKFPQPAKPKWNSGPKRVWSPYLKRP